jgi:UDP-3-O-[3-hydroxymyristoyl] N-acetylglucosamine deacetylase
MVQQRTVKSVVVGEGVALHSGARTSFRIVPAPPGTGIVFIRTDLSPRVAIPARAEHVVDTRLATTLGAGGATVSTVEHLLAALAGLGVDNASVEIDGPEVPVLDGSAMPFVELIRAAGGTAEQRAPRRFVVVRRAVAVSDATGERSARLEPAPGFSLRCLIDFDHPLIHRQSLELELTETAFVREVARARTFGFARDLEAMRAAGLARGGSVDNAVVVDDFSVRNPDGLRFPDEFVRHKLLDAIGDLALLGAPLLGRYVGQRSGHALNTQLVAALLAQPRAFELVEARPRGESSAPKLAPLRLGGMATA